MNQNTGKFKKIDWDAVDSPPLSDEMFAKMQPVNEQHPEIPKRVRGNQKQPLKITVSIRLNPDVVAWFKSQGKGWQTTISDVLDDYVKKQQDESV